MAFASLATGNYPDGMTARVLRLLVLVALVLMPFTMTAAPAKAHAMPPALGSEHCSDHQSPDAPRSTDMAQCMLMCAALPAAESLRDTTPEMPKGPRQLAFATPIHGVILEIATPPPRLS